MNNQTKFAYCANEHSGCYCPMIAAGWDPDDEFGPRIIELYDDEAILITGTDGSPGLMSEADAEEAWQRAYDRAENTGVRETMKIIADDLDWELQ
jgi:hypothetical protein